MVTTVFRAPQTMEINLPPSEQKVDVAESNLMTLYVTENQSVFWTIGREAPHRVDFKDLQTLLAEKNKANPKLITLVKLDRKAPYHMMVDMLDELNIGNITRFSVAPLTDRDKEVLSKA
jgi:biopolymer transport protein ExbD